MIMIASQAVQDLQGMMASLRCFKWTSLDFKASPSQATVVHNGCQPALLSLLWAVSNTGRQQ